MSQTQQRARKAGVRTKKYSEAQLLAKVNQSIEVPKEVLAVNVGKLSKKEEIPEVATQWDQGYGFHLATFNISFVTQRGERCVRGIKKVKIDGDFDKPEISVMDVLPKTSWIPKNYSAEVSFGLDPLGMIGKVVEVPTGVTAGLTFKYNWNPKAARVISSGAQAGVHWYSERASDEYLDGNYQVSVMFSHPKTVTGPFKLKLQLFVHHDIAVDYDDYTKVEKELTVKVNL